MITVRPLDLEQDVAALRQLLGLTHVSPPTEDQIREWWRERPDEFRVTRVAHDAQGEVVAMLEVSQSGWLRSGHCYVNEVVDPMWRGQGVGLRLHAEGVALAQARGATYLDAEVRDNDATSRQFAERRGYAVERHTFESILDLDSFDETPVVDSLARAEAAGLRFFSLADLGLPVTAASQRRLYELNRAVARDNPGNVGVFEPFEGFRQTVFEAAWFRPDGQILAADGERWVGLAALVYHAGGVEAYNGFTGVDAAYRGRGLATALKLLAIRQARAYGAHTLRTHNDSRNAPMLAVNRKLGYRPQPGIFHLVAPCPPAL